MRMKEASSRLTESFEHTGSFKIGHKALLKVFVSDIKQDNQQKTYSTKEYQSQKAMMMQLMIMVINRI